MTHQPIEARYRQMMNDLAKNLDRSFNGKERPKKVGFALLVFDFGNPDRNRMNYISNGHRDDMIVALKEFIARNEGRVHETDTKQ